MAERNEGFNCVFVNKLPRGVQSRCPMCLLVLREPYQTICCGYAFCRVCIEKIKVNNKHHCPCCNTKKFETVENRTLKIALDASRIHCTYRQQGCQWEGELGQLDNHLNYNPTKDKQLEGCQFAQIKCRYCSMIYQRSDLQFHQSNHCPRRPFSCRYCKNYHSNYKNITNQHWFICGYVPRPCLKNCGANIQRRNLQSHITTDCPMTIIDCDFQHVGCEVRLPRKDMPAHLKESMVRHVSLHAAYSKLVFATVERLDEEYTQNTKRLSRFIEDVEMQNIGIPLCPVEITVTSFEQKLRDGAHWRSSPFYTHEKGYKMCLHVHVYGEARDIEAYVSAYINLMKGQFDSKLKWPFQGKIEIQLLNREQNEEHLKRTIDFTNATEAGKRVMETETAVLKFGIRDFIYESDLRPKFIKNDCLKFCIKCIVLT